MYRLFYFPLHFQTYIALIYVFDLQQIWIFKKIMEKYRKWTDQATGINPFIIADPKTHNLLYTILINIKSFFIQTWIILLFVLPLVIFAALFPFLSIFNYLMLLLAGNITTYDDNKFTNDLNKLNKKKNKIILSNFSSIMDVFYYMFKISGPKFVVIHQNTKGQQSYQLIKGLKCIKRVLLERQPFFVYHEEQIQNQYSKNLKNLIQQNSNSHIIIFYEGIRTNGLGTLKLSKQLSQQLYQVESDYLTCKISYSPRDQLYFNMVRNPILNFFMSLGSFSFRTLKARSQITDYSNIHNFSELKKDIDEFMSTNGSKLLETNPKDFENFIFFFKKTQKKDYVHQSK